MNSLVVKLVLYLVALAVAAAMTSFTEGGGAPYQIARPEEISVKFSDIGGLAAQKREIFYTILLPLRNTRFFRDERLRPPRGHLFVGPPGTGKTMLARAIAKAANVPFLSITLSSVQSKLSRLELRLESSMLSPSEERATCRSSSSVSQAWSGRGPMRSSRVSK